MSQSVLRDFSYKQAWVTIIFLCRIAKKVNPSVSHWLKSKNSLFLYTLKSSYLVNIVYWRKSSALNFHVKRKGKMHKCIILNNQCVWRVLLLRTSWSVKCMITIVMKGCILANASLMEGLIYRTSPRRPTMRPWLLRFSLMDWLMDWLINGLVGITTMSHFWIGLT